MKYIAHRDEAGREQLLIEHLRNTAARCKYFAAVFQAGQWGEFAGLYHDIGKYSDGFIKRINENGSKVDHSTAGAIEVKNKYQGISLPLTFCIAGHHGGLPNLGTQIAVAGDGTLNGRLKKKLQDDLDYRSYASEVTMDLKPPEMPARNVFKDQFYSGAFFIRMLFSCLVDADFLDTEAFCATDKAENRGRFADIPELTNLLLQYLAGFKSGGSPINSKRQQILQECKQQAKSAPGLFSLTVPTGGGKTLSSLAFALLHAKKYGQQRVIYVIPYTSIIEQTADIFRNILGEDNVIEHHMNVDYYGSNDEDIIKQKYKLATENWDAPVIVTTNVQFFESLYGNKTSKCRKLHNIANSVVVFDEAQMLPNDYLLPCVRAIAELVQYYKVTAVLCTATQPSLNKIFPQQMEIKEICSDIQDLYDFFKRVEFKEVTLPDEVALVAKLNQYDQVLCITNSKKEAQIIFDQLKGERGVSVFHLSTFMYPVHRREVLKKIRSCLLNGKPCKVVTTSLIEAGVDVDFPVVYRELAGLDSIIQAAGRCNREGKNTLENSKVFIYSLTEPAYGKTPAFVRQQVEITKTILKDHQDVASVAAIKDYFDRLHFFKGYNLDVEAILDKSNSGQFPFREIAEKFVLIKEDTRTVFVPFDASSEKIAALLRNGIRTRELLRQMAQYAVQVYEYQYQKMLALGQLKCVDNNICILLDREIYDADKGLLLNMEEGQSIFC